MVPFTRPCYPRKGRRGRRVLRWRGRTTLGSDGNRLDGVSDIVNFVGVTRDTGAVGRYRVVKAHSVDKTEDGEGRPWYLDGCEVGCMGGRTRRVRVRLSIDVSAF